MAWLGLAYGGGVPPSYSNRFQRISQLFRPAGSGTAGPGHRGRWVAAQQGRRVVPRALPPTSVVSLTSTTPTRSARRPRRDRARGRHPRHVNLWWWTTRCSMAASGPPSRPWPPAFAKPPTDHHSRQRNRLLNVIVPTNFHRRIGHRNRPGGRQRSSPPNSPRSPEHQLYRRDRRCP